METAALSAFVRAGLFGDFFQSLNKDIVKLWHMDKSKKSSFDRTGKMAMIVIIVFFITDCLGHLILERYLVCLT
jgi:hypothetical protein